MKALDSIEYLMMKEQDSIAVIYWAYHSLLGLPCDQILAPHILFCPPYRQDTAVWIKKAEMWLHKWGWLWTLKTNNHFGDMQPETSWPLKASWEVALFSQRKAGEGLAYCVFQRRRCQWGESLPRATIPENTGMYHERDAAWSMTIWLEKCHLGKSDMNQ